MQQVKQPHATRYQRHAACEDEEIAASRFALGAIVEDFSKAIAISSQTAIGLQGPSSKAPEKLIAKACDRRQQQSHQGQGQPFWMLHGVPSKGFANNKGCALKI
jgi:hypothetical protein